MRARVGFPTHNRHAIRNAQAKRAVYSPMENSKQFREFAEECGRLAQEASTEEQRRVLTKLAAAWSKIAEEYARGDLTRAD